MLAAMQGADETVAFLLSKGASPHLMNNREQTALIMALQSECSSTIDLLAPLATEGLDKALMWLAPFHTKLTPAVEGLLRRAASDKDVARMGMHYATFNGATSMLKILTQGWDKNTLDPTEANQLLERALMSDNADTVDTVRAFVPSVSSENIALALTRGRADVLKLLGLGEDERSIGSAKKKTEKKAKNRNSQQNSKH